MKLRKAVYGDIEELMRVFSQARMAQRRAGFMQWDDGYPSADVLRSDIDNSIGFVLDDCGKIAGYVAIATKDCEYDRHPELWDVTASYAVLHRIALSDGYRGRRLSGELFDLAERHAFGKGACFVRIDTGVENKPMQHILSKRGYAKLGCVDFIWGERLACEKPLVKDLETDPKLFPDFEGEGLSEP